MTMKMMALGMQVDDWFLLFFPHGRRFLHGLTLRDQGSDVVAPDHVELQ